MESILVLTHDDATGGKLSKGSLEAVAAGKELSTRLNATFTVGFVCGDLKKLESNLPATGGRWLTVSGEAFEQPRYASDAAACEAICRAAQATIVLAPHGSRFARVLAAVAHRMGGCVDTHMAAICGAESAPGSVEATRWFYRQRIEAVLTRASRPWFMLLDPGTHSPYAGEFAPAQAEQVAVALPALRTRVICTRLPQQGAAGEQDAPDGATIRPDAKLLFVAGAGWTKRQPDGQIHAAEAGNLIVDFLRCSGASLGSSKSLVDQGGDGSPVLPFLTHLNQVGQTGSSPRHPKGLATCCHGEEPHVVGWRFVGERRAVSLDPNCGWTRGKADVVYVADAFQVVSRLNALLAARGILLHQKNDDESSKD